VDARSYPLFCAWDRGRRYRTMCLFNFVCTFVRFWRFLDSAKSTSSANSTNPALCLCMCVVIVRPQIGATFCPLSQTRQQIYLRKCVSTLVLFSCSCMRVIDIHPFLPAIFSSLSQSQLPLPLSTCCYARVTLLLPYCAPLYHQCVAIVTPL
jgi:hypothetical protein